MQIIKLREEVETAFPQYSLHLYKERYESETQCLPNLVLRQLGNKCTKLYCHSDCMVS